MTRDRASALAALALAGLTLAALALAALGCRGADDRFPDASVVLVSIDTLRADRLGAYGYTKGRTPTLDGLAREGVLFESVWSHCPLTLPAHASLLTGLLPPRHGVRDNLGFVLDPRHLTLASRFKAAGLATGGAVSAYVLRSATGIAQGFDAYDDRLETSSSAEGIGEQQRDGAVAVESLSRWIEAQNGRRFFAFLHLYEPHTPYAPPPQHRDLKDPYDGEVAYADELVGRLLARLRTGGLLDRVIVAVTADHGEGLLDHGEQEHGLFLYREAVQVPLILRLPGGRRAGTRVTGVVAQVDVPATLLDLARVGAEGLDGVSQRAALASGRAASRTVYSETLYPRYHFGWSELFAATENRYRYVRAPRPELYDVQRDPAEKSNVAAAQPSTASALDAWLQREGGAGHAPAPGPISEETREALAALGYVTGGAAVAGPAGSLPDPKDKLAVYNTYREAVQQRRQGRLEEAVRGLRAVVADSPGMLDAWQALGTTLLRLGRGREAVSALEEIVRRDPTNGSANLALARLHALAGRLDEAEKRAALASAQEPGRSAEILAGLALERNRPDDAVRHARRALDADPGSVTGHFVLGRVAQRSGRCEDAVAEYGRALEGASRDKGLVVPGLHAGLADCLAREGREADAEREFRAEIALIPASREARVGLAVLFRSQGRDGEARDVLAGLVSANPRAGADEYLLVVRTLTGLGDRDAARAWASRARSRYPSDPRFR